MNQNLTEHSKQIKAIKRHVLTEVRAARNDIIVRTTEKGGYDLITISNLDVLLECEIITQDQERYGKIFWTIRDTSFFEMQLRIGDYDYITPIDDNRLEAITDESLAEPGMATEMFLALRRRISKNDWKILNASCETLEAAYLPMKMAIIWAFGEIPIRNAFIALEENYEKAKEDAEWRINNPHPKEISCKTFQNA